MGFLVCFLSCWPLKTDRDPLSMFKTNALPLSPLEWGIAEVVDIAVVAAHG